MMIGNGSYIKKINKSFIIEKIIEYQTISRADLSKITGLNKTTVSAQVAELLEEELVYETQSDYNLVGRKPVMLSIKKDSGYILGIDFDYKKTQMVISNLVGSIIEQKTFYFETEDYKEIISLLANKIISYTSKYSQSTYGLISCIIGVHGTVSNSETIQLISKYQWSNISFKKDIEELTTIPIIIENNANLSALAEKVYYYNDTSPLLSINLSSGIGAGRIIDWKIDKGYQGFAGEMGHMIIHPDGPKCTCGQYGCWELFAAEDSLFTQLSKSLNKKISTIDDLKQLLNADRPDIKQIIQKYFFYISIGLKNIINLYNPGIIVLNSRLLTAFPNPIEQITKSFTFNAHSYEKIVLSKLGKKSCVLGECALGIMQFFVMSRLQLHNSDYINQ